MAKKIDYASMFTLRKDGRYQHFDSKRTPKYLYDRDPEALYRKVEFYKNPPPPSFEMVAELWQEAKWPEIRDGTHLCYEPALKRAVQEQKGKSITEISPQDINNHLKKMIAQGYSKHTISVQKTVYVMIFDYAIVSDDPRISGWLKINPASSVKLSRGLPRKKREAPEDDIIEIIRANTDKPFGLFPRMLINTGFRKGEICALTWGDIDLKAGTITCSKAIEYNSPGLGEKEPKTEAGVRTVPILPDLKSVLKRPKGAKDSDPVFPGKNGYLTKDEYTSLWTQWCKTAKLTKTVPRTRKPTKTEIAKNKNIKARAYKKTVPSITAHQLRHYYATMLFEAGVDELTAMQLMGHKDRRTIHDIYEHLRDKQKNQAVDVLAKYQSKRYTGLDADIILTQNDVSNPPKNAQNGPSEGAE